jgi:hypothetical protein
MNIAPTNDPWKGGSITRASRPVDVLAQQGWQDANPSSASAPSITIKDPAFARNNSGSNVRM